jgi:hypothetical protein
MKKSNKVWCKHIKYWSRREHEDDGVMIPFQEGWSYTKQISLVQTNKWKFCPICGTPKPKKL